jgi:hypothetical protein
LFSPCGSNCLISQSAVISRRCRLGMRHCYCANGHDKTYTLYNRLCNLAFLPKNNENMWQLMFLWRWLRGYGVL